MAISASIIIKASGECNLNCSYCYYYIQEPQINKRIMDLEIAQRVIMDSLDLGSKIELIWHGGEPLLAGKEFFKAVVDLEKKIERETGTCFSNRIQTNATLIDQEWIEIFKSGNFGVGVSLDGCEDLHNHHRVFLSGKGSYQETMKGIGILKKAGVPFSVLAVVTKESLQRVEEIYKSFSFLGFRRFDFLPMLELDSIGNRIPGSLDKGEFASFMGEVFDLWFLRDDSRISIRYFEQVLSVFFGNSPSLCKMNGSCYEYITVDYNGDVYPCDNFIGYDDLKYGSLLKQHLKDIIKTNKATDIKKRLSINHLECVNCFAYPYCNGGCNKYRYINGNSFSSPFYFCDDTRMLLQHIKQIIISEHPLLERVC